MPVCDRRARLRSPSFHAVTRVEPSRTVIRLRGELDIATLPRLVRAVGRTLRTSTKVIVLDLHDLEFVDVVGLRGIEVLTRQLATVGCRVTVTNVPNRVMRLVSTIGAHHLTITS
jgi:anti-anti-sigma factor